jgi:RNA polymerase sigma-70 factor (ECF subfamily)
VRLSRLLLRHLPDTLRRGDRLEERLESELEEAVQRWPNVTVDDAAFFTWVSTRIPADALSVEQGLDGLRVADLYLACACAKGDPKALAAFDAAFLAGDSRTPDDVKQALRKNLFVAARGAAPRIALYGGRGDLSAWVRASAARMEIDEVRAARDIPTEDSLLEAIGIDPGQNPGLAQVKKDSKAAFQAAFREAVGTLSDRERNLLVQYYVDGLALAELGTLYALAPSSISRSLAKSRVILLSGIRRSLLRHKKLAGEDVESLVTLVRTQLSLTGGIRRS